MSMDDQYALPMHSKHANRNQFLNPSDEAKPWTFWYWMYGACSKDVHRPIWRQ